MATESRSLGLEVKTAGDTTVVRFAGQQVHLGEQNWASLCDRLAAHARAPGLFELVVDFNNVASVSSTALGALVSLHEQLHEAHRRLTLCNVADQVHDAFVLNRLDTYLRVHRSRAVGQPVSNAGVLVVDDDPGVRSVLDAALRGGGFPVWTAGDGVTALAVFREKNEAIGLVLLDVNMPTWNGARTLKELRGVRPDICCCFMTAGGGYLSEADLLGMGALRVLAKPLCLEEVVQFVRQVLNTHAA